jgi:site-specific DNA-methyltransferase (adenine-specific)
MRNCTGLIKPYYDRNGITIYLGDCLEIMPQLDLVFDAVVADPPYFKIVSEDWDRQWHGLDDYVEWLERVIIEIKKALTTKGSLYVFGDDKTIAYVQVMIDRYLTLLNSLVWFKVNNRSVKAAPNLRSYAPMTERILFYTPQLCKTGLETVKLDLNNFVPLREYFRDYQRAIGLNGAEIDRVLGHTRADHCFRWDSTQWDLPTKEVYAELGRAFNTNGFLRRDYESLRRDYESLRRDYESLRRTFNATSKTFDVISGPIVSQSDNTDHPTTKPLWLITRLIQTCTNKGDLILDPFMGSGTTLLAAQNEGRRAVGIETSEEYIKIAIERLRQPSFFSIPEKATVKARQLTIEI